MSRFKELNRITNAIKHESRDELLWALGYCQSRLAIVKMKEHKKQWNILIKKIEDSLKDIQSITLQSIQSSTKSM